MLNDIIVKTNNNYEKNWIRRVGQIKDKKVKRIIIKTEGVVFFSSFCIGRNLISKAYTTSKTNTPQAKQIIICGKIIMLMISNGHNMIYTLLNVSAQ